MQRISVNVTNDCDGNQLHYNNDLPVIGNKNYALQKLFKINFLTLLSETRNCDRYLSSVEWPKAPDFAL